MKNKEFLIVPPGQCCDLLVSGANEWLLIEQITQDGITLNLRRLGTFVSLKHAEAGKRAEISMRKAMAVLGSRGGLAKSAAKRASSKQNGASGGRPKKPVDN